MSFIKERHKNPVIWQNLKKVEVVNRINVMIKGVKGKMNKLELRFAHDQRTRGNNGWIFFPTFILFIKKFQVAIPWNLIFFSNFNNGRRNRSRRRCHLQFEVKVEGRVDSKREELGKNRVFRRFFKQNGSWKMKVKKTVKFLVKRRFSLINDISGCVRYVRRLEQAFEKLGL